MPPGLGVLGGLAGAGAQGAAGAFEGVLEGETLRRKFAGQDLQNQLHMLQQIALKQDIAQRGQPNEEIAHGFKITRAFPGGPVIKMEPLPQPPLRADQQSLADLHATQNAGAKLHNQEQELKLQEFRQWQARPENKNKGYGEFLQMLQAQKHHETLPEGELVLLKRYLAGDPTMNENERRVGEGIAKKVSGDKPPTPHAQFVQTPEGGRWAFATVDPSKPSPTGAPSYSATVTPNMPELRKEPPHHDPGTELGILNRINDPKTPTDERTRLQKSLTDYRALQQGKSDSKLDLQMMRGGPWVDKKTGQIVDNLTRGDWSSNGGHEAYKPITKNQQQTIDLLEAEAMPQIDQLRTIGERILARYPGQNLAKLLENQIKGKLSDPDVREYGQARNIVTFTLSRAIGGSAAVRQFIFKALSEAETPTVGDTKVTMRRMAENSRTAIMNFIRSAKGWKPYPLPSTARTIEALSPKGEVVQIKLAPYEPLPEGFQYRY